MLKFLPEAGSQARFYIGLRESAEAKIAVLGPGPENRDRNALKRSRTGPASMLLRKGTAPQMEAEELKGLPQFSSESGADRAQVSPRSADSKEDLNYDLDSKYTLRAFMAIESQLRGVQSHERHSNRAMKCY